MKKHTFVVCAYKESPFLEECIRSLKNQSQKSNIMVVTSTPCDYIRNLAEQYEIPYYVNEGEGGITQDWNFGYAKAVEVFDSEYITIAHQDDTYDREYLETVEGMISKTSRPLIFFCNYYEIRNGEKVYQNKLLKVKSLMLLPLRVKALQKSVWVRRRILSLGSPICCPSVTFAVKNLPKVIFENHFRACEDWEAWEKLSKLKGAFVYSPQYLMGHRIHEGSETSAIIGDNKRTDEELEMFCKFWPKKIAAVLVKQYAKGQDSNNLNAKG